LYRIGIMGVVVTLIFKWGGLAPVARSMRRGLLSLLTVYAALALVSTAWSVFPAWTAYKSWEYLVDIAMIAAILNSLRGLDELKTLYDLSWTYCAALTVCVWLGVLLAPADAILRDVGVLGFQIVGVAPALSANSVGDLGATLATVATARLLRRNCATRTLYLAVMAAALATLFCAQTRSSLVAFVAAALFMLLIARRIRALALAFLAAAFVFALSNAAKVTEAYIVRDQSPEMFLSLSGRVTWWEFAWQKYLERPYTGYGAYAGGRFAAMAEFGSGMTSSLHNTYMEVLLGSGPAGVLLIVLVVAWMWWRLMRFVTNFQAGRLESELALESAGIFTMVTARSFFSSAIVWHDSFDFLLVLAFIEYLRRRSRRREHPA
jgi:O-antigen ligase